MIEVGKSYRANDYSVIVKVMAVTTSHAWVYNTGPVNTTPYTLTINGMKDWPEYVEPVVETRWADIRLMPAQFVHSQWSHRKCHDHNVEGTFTNGILTEIRLIKG